MNLLAKLCVSHRATRVKVVAFAFFFVIPVGDLRLARTTTGARR